MRSSVVSGGQSIRRLRFALLERFVLPLAVLLFRALMWTWTKEAPSPTFFEEIATMPRVIFTIFHSTLFEALAFGQVWKPHGRHWMILTTPSLDGRLAVSMLNRLGLAHAHIVRGAPGIEAAREYIDRIGTGEVGIILVDGPRGPREVVKPGVIRTIDAAGARVVAVGFASSRGGRARSWDRTVVPAPFARVHCYCQLLPEPAPGNAYSRAALQAAMDAARVQASRALAAPS